MKQQKDSLNDLFEQLQITALCWLIMLAVLLLFFLCSCGDKGEIVTTQPIAVWTQVPLPTAPPAMLSTPTPADMQCQITQQIGIRNGGVVMTVQCGPLPANEAYAAIEACAAIEVTGGH